MTRQDPFALVRSRDSFTLDEAARIAHDVPPHRVYPRGRNGWTQELRDEFAAVGAVLHQLKADAERLGVSVQHVPASTTYGRASPFTGEPTTYQHPARTEYGNVGREALKHWCEDNGLRPEFFCSPEQPAPAKQLQTLEKETLLGLIGVLCEAAGIDLRQATKGHAEAKRIKAWATARNVKASTETIAAKVVAARELIAPKGPVDGQAGAESHSNSNRHKTNSNS